MSDSNDFEFKKLLQNLTDENTEDTSALTPIEIAEKYIKESVEDSAPNYDSSYEDVLNAVMEAGPDMEPVYKKPDGVIDSITRPIKIALTAAKDGITNLVSSDVKIGSNYALSPEEQAIYGVSQNVGKWLVTGGLAAGTAMTGGALSAGLGLLKQGSILLDTISGAKEVYKGIYEDALTRGLSEEDAKNSASWGTAMSMPFEYLGDRYIGKVFSKASVKSLEKQLVRAGAARRLYDAKGKPIAVQIIDKDLAEKIITDSKTIGLYDVAGTVANEASTETIQGRLENLGELKNDPNMQLEDIFEGTLEDAALGAVGAGVIHGIAKGIEKSPIGKLATKRIAEMHRRRFGFGNATENDTIEKSLVPTNNSLVNNEKSLMPLSLTTNVNNDNSKQEGFNDDFYASHTLIDSDTQQIVDWEDIEDNKYYDIMYHDGYAGRQVSGKQAKVYAQKILNLRINPETKQVVVPADIEYPGATSNLVVNEDGTTTITPNTETISDDPIKGPQEAEEQVNQTRATIMREQGVSEETIKNQSFIPGAANQQTFGKISEGPDIQDDVFGKPDIVGEGINTAWAPLEEELSSLVDRVNKFSDKYHLATEDFKASYDRDVARIKELRKLIQQAKEDFRTGKDLPNYNAFKQKNKNPEFIASDINKETNNILSDLHKGKSPRKLVSKNNVMTLIHKFAKKFLDINIDPTLDTEGFIDANGKIQSSRSNPNILGKTYEDEGYIRTKNAGDAFYALHEIGHYLFRKGRRLKDSKNKLGSFESFMAKNNFKTTDFDSEMMNLWGKVMDPVTLLGQRILTTTYDIWTDNRVKTDLSKYPQGQRAEEVFVSAFALYVANQDNFREQFKKYAPKTFNLLEEYFKQRDMTKAIQDMHLMYDAYASQSQEARGTADTMNIRPGKFRKTFDVIRKFFGDRHHFATFMAKTFNNLSGVKAASKELGDTKYENPNKYEFLRGVSRSAIKAFISGNGMRWGIGDLLGTKFKNYDTIITNVRKLKSITDKNGGTLSGLERFNLYVVAKNTIGEMIGNDTLTRDVEDMSKKLHQTVRTTLDDVLRIRESIASGFPDKQLLKKYSNYLTLIEEIRQRSEWVGTPLEFKQALDVIEAAEAQPDFNELDQNFNDLQYFWRCVQNFVAEMSPSMKYYIEAMRANSGGYYTPLMRQIIEGTNNYNAVVTERRGSDRPSYTSIENVPAEIAALIYAGLRASAKDMLMLMSQMENSGVYVQEVEAPKQAITLDVVMGDIISELRKRLPKGTQLDPQVVNALSMMATTEMFINAPESDITGNVFSLIVIDSKGNPTMRYFKAEPGILEMIREANITPDTKIILNFLNAFNTMQKNFFTRYSMKFVYYYNTTRDMFTASIRGNQRLITTGIPLVDNDWLNAIMGCLVNTSSMYINWLTNSNEWQNYQEAMSVLGVSTNQIVNEYNAILSRTKPSVNSPLGRLSFLTSKSFEKFLKQLDSSDMLVRTAELKYLLKTYGVDVEDVYLSKERVCSLSLSKNKLDSLGLTYNMFQHILTPNQRTIYENTPSNATLSLHLDENQYLQIQQIVNNSNIRTQTKLTPEQLVHLHGEASYCTTNFLQHGKWSDALNVIMLFSRAGINGTLQLGTVIDRRRSQGQAGMIYGRIASCAVWSLIFYTLFKDLFDDDDEDEEDMWNGIRIKLGDATLDIPVLPEDLLGWNMGKVLAKGEFSLDFIKHFAAAVNPLKSAGAAGLVLDLATGKKMSRVGWDDWAEPIIPPYLKQKYGDEYEKMVSYNTGIVARALSKAFGNAPVINGAPVTWQYAINNLGFGKVIKLVESAAGVDKSILMPDSSIIPTGNGSLDYISKQLGINRPLYRSKYEKKLDDLYKEAVKEHSLAPKSEEATAKYLFLYNAIKLQQNLNKLRFYATSTEQQKELVKMKNLVARNVYKSYTEDILDTPTVRATNRMVKSALEQTQEQLKETGEGTPYNNLKELVDKQTKGENNEIR